jgi:ATP-dependent exoDNAse (exonuclease V) alpha subunit
LDQGISVTSHASQGKTVDNLIVSAPVAAFAQVSQAQLYVSMSRARKRCAKLFADQVNESHHWKLSAEHAFKRDNYHS